MNKIWEDKIKKAKENGHVGYMIVCDCFEYEDYMVIIEKESDLPVLKNIYNQNMQRVMEIKLFKEEIK